jgi:uncharacterized membrane-anchored protein YitT (DUF2179 family)
VTPILHELKNTALITGGIFSAAFGIKGFLLSSHFIDGGVTGVSMLLTATTGVSLAILLPLINLPFVAVGYRHIGPRFAAKSAIAMIGLAAVLYFIDFPDVTPDKLLTAVFGGLFIGAGIGLTIRGGAVLDGTEIAALLVSRHSSILGVSDVVLLLNVIIFLAAAFFLGVEVALYSILTYVAASKALDFLIHGFEEYTAITIVSQRSQEIKTAITDELRSGVTVFRGDGGAGSTGESEVGSILLCVVTRLEIGGVRNLAKEIDPEAFITTHSLNDVDGGLIKRPYFTDH